MVSRRLAQVSTSALCSPAAILALNSAQVRMESMLHCTLVCCRLNLATRTAAPHRSHSTGRSAASRSSTGGPEGSASPEAGESRGSGGDGIGQVPRVGHGY